MQHGPAAEVGRGLEVDLHRPTPGGVPVVQRGVGGDGLEHPGIVDQHIDPPAEAIQRLIPQPLGGGRVGQVGPDHVAAIGAPVGDDPRASGAERLDDRRADAAGSASHQDMGDRDVGCGISHGLS